MTVLSRWVALALAFLAAVVVAVSGVAAGPAAAVRAHPADYVIIVGMAGLRWDDLDAQNAPAMWQLAQQGSIGSIAVRSARTPTCRNDGWLTLGAGNYAGWGPAKGQCLATDARIERPDRLGAHLPDQRAVVRRNSESLPWGAVPGALAESLRCTAAVGAGAAVAAARPYGRVDRYEPALPVDLVARKDLLDNCVLSIVDAGAISGAGPARRSAVHLADQQVASVVAAAPPRTTLLVVGVADTGDGSRLHVAIASGDGWQSGWLTSASTGRDGYLQLVDVAPTVLAALGRPAPQRLFVGRPAVRAAGRPADLLAAVAQPADADREARAQRRVAGWFFGALTVGQILLYLSAIPLLRRARRHAGPGGPPGLSARALRLMELLSVAASLAIPAALIADAVPWWRTDHSGGLFLLAWLLILAGLTAATVLLPWFRRTWGPMALAASCAALVVGLDVLTGASLQLNGVAGYSALEGGRYAGIGTVGLGVLVAGALIAAGCVAQQLRRQWRPAVFVGVGGAAVLLVGSPYFGGDAVGAIAVTAGVCVAAVLSTGAWLTFARVAWATLAGVAVALGFAVLDLHRPMQDQGSLGRFLTQWSNGQGGLTIHRTGVANVMAFATSPLTILAIVAALFVWLALLRSWGGLKRLYGIYPAIRAAMAGVAVAAVLAGAVGGAALNVAGAAAATAVPLALLAALRVLDHAAERTRAIASGDGPSRPESGELANPPAG